MNSKLANLLVMLFQALTWVDTANSAAPANRVAMALVTALFITFFDFNYYVNKSVDSAALNAVIYNKSN